jgi:uncharacterized protein (DUF2147 family)
VPGPAGYAGDMLAASLALILSAPVGIAGDWVTADRSAVVRVGRCGDTVCGRVVRVLARGVPTHDANNPDRALRRRPLVGVAVLSGFAPGGAGDGRAYDPKTGRSYRARLRLNPDGTLRVTGCVTIICRSQTWTRPN